MYIKYRSNLCAGIISIVLGIICALIIPSEIGTDYSTTYGITSRSVPYAVSILWVLCGIILLVQSLVFHKDELKYLDLKKELKALVYIAVLLIYSLIFNKSFLISNLFLGFITLRFTGCKKKSYYFIILALVLLIYFSFKYGLHIQMP